MKAEDSGGGGEVILKLCPIVSTVLLDQTLFTLSYQQINVEEFEYCKDVQPCYWAMQQTDCMINKNLFLLLNVQSGSFP